MKNTEIRQKLFISAILLVLFMTVPAMAGTVIPSDVGSSNPYFIKVANDGGASADLYGNDTYAMHFHGGGYGVMFENDSLFDSADTTGENFFSDKGEGSFYLNFYGGRGGLQRVVLMLAVNGTIPDDFSAHFRTSGYRLNYSSTLAERLGALTPDDISYESTGIDETFTKSDFIYGPQVTRPPGTAAIYHSQDTSDTSDTFRIMFIDTGLGIVGNRQGAHGTVLNSDLTDTGKMKVEYSFANLGDCMAVVDAYGWLYSGTDSSDDLDPSISWTNYGSGDGELVVMVDNQLTAEPPVANFTASTTYGDAPLTVMFTDESTNSPASWSWEFGDGENSTEQNPEHTYTDAGKYTVSLTAANSGGHNTTIMTDYITVGVAGGSLLADSAWPEFGYNSMHTGLSPNNGPQKAIEKWTYSLGGRVRYCGPAIGTDGTIYIGTYGDKKLHAIDPNGTQKWEFATGGYIYNTPSISSEGTIYFGSYDGNLYALNPDGTEKWRFSNGGQNFGSPTIGSDGTIYFGSRDHKVYALNPDGTEKWSFSTGHYIYGSPALGSDGTVYIGGYDNNLYAINPDGTLKWSYAANDKIYMSPVIDSDGTIYFGTYTSGRTFYAINPDGSLKWEKNIGSALYYGSPAIGPDGTIYVPCYQAQCILALDPDGTEKWSYSIGGSIYSSPVIGSDGTVYIGCYGSRKICAINPDGSLKWEYSPGVYFYGSPAIGADGTLYIADYSAGNLYAFENVVDFTTDKASGESPMTVQFTGVSTRSVSTWSWDFGDGASSTDQSPSHTYTSDGSYNVTLTITEEGTGETFTADKPAYINTYTAPVAAFSADATSGQVPMTVNFTDESANGPTKWLWDFGDGNTSSEQSPEYAYLNPGTYTVTLDVENPAGNSREVKNNYITIDAQPAPAVEFNASVVEGQAPLEVDFTDLSTESPISWSWGFGNGAVSAEQNPTLTYTVPGIYTVELSAANYGGSGKEVKTGYINVTPQDPPVAAFDATNITITDDSAVNSIPVPFTVRFTQEATGYNITSYLWDFGDGTNSTEEDPAHTYESQGNYMISLTVSNDGGTDTKLINLTAAGVVTPVVDFSVNRTYGKYPMTVRFTDESLYDPTSWSWDFGDGSTSTEQNPVHTYSSIGAYDVTLKATNSAGSNATTKTDYMHAGTTNAQPMSNYRNINIYVANDEGVKWDEPDGLTRYEGIGIPYNYVPNTYFVLFGTPGGGSNPMDISSDPDGQKGRVGQVTETYDQSGEFWVTFNGGQSYMHEGVLMIAVNGTIPDDFSVRIRSSGYDFVPPIPSVGNNNSISTPVYTEGAINQTFTIDDFIYGPQIWKPFGLPDYPIYTGQDMSDTGNTFQIMFVDLYLGATKTGTDQGSIKVEYEFNNLTSFAVFNSFGWYRASNHGTGIIMTNCGSYYAVTGIPDAPLADFTAEPVTGELPLTVQFTDTSSGVPTEWSWDFDGDGVVDSTEQNPEYTYTAMGTYPVKLTVENYKGTDSILKEELITVKGHQQASGGVEIKNNGTITDNGDGTVNYSVNQSQAQVKGNDVVIDSGGYTLTYKSDTPPAVVGGNIVTTVTEIELETDPVETTLDEVGNVSGSLDLSLNNMSADSSLQITLTKGDSGSGSDFRLAASTDGLSVDNVAYTMNVVKTNLTNGQEIKEAKITMSVPVEWVNANGGTEAIKIIRVAEDGTKEVLVTRHMGTANGIMTFEGYSPNGLSLFGLAAVSTRDVIPSSGSVSSSGGGKSDQGIDSAEKVKAGETATLTFDKTSIYEIDFYAKSDIPELLVTIESGAKPGDSLPQGDVYDYLYAGVYKAPEGSIEKDTIRFTVPSAWVDKRISSPDLLSLWYYDESSGDWEKLSTVFEKEEGGLCYYFADSANLGYLAIAAQPDHAVSTPTQSAVSEQTPDADTKSTPAASQPTSTPKATPLFGSTILFVAFGLLCVVAAVNRRSRQNR